MPRRLRRRRRRTPHARGEPPRGALRRDLAGSSPRGQLRPRAAHARARGVTTAPRVRRSPNCMLVPVLGRLGAAWLAPASPARLGVIPARTTRSVDPPAPRGHIAAPAAAAGPRRSSSPGSRNPENAQLLHSRQEENFWARVLIKEAADVGEGFRKRRSPPLGFFEGLKGARRRGAGGSRGIVHSLCLVVCSRTSSEQPFAFHPMLRAGDIL